MKICSIQWALALGIGLVGANVIGFTTYLVVPAAKYTARSMLHVNSVQPRILLTTGEVHTEYGAYQRTQLALLHSRLVLSSALKQPEVAKLPILTTVSDPIPIESNCSTTSR